LGAEAAPAAGLPHPPHAGLLLLLLVVVVVVAAVAAAVVVGAAPASSAAALILFWGWFCGFVEQIAPDVMLMMGTREARISRSNRILTSNTKSKHAAAGGGDL
jgi:hypothetical protein